MEQTGIVIKTEKDRAMVKIIRSAACGATCGSCGLCEQREKTRWVLNPIKAREGESVKIEMKSSSLLFLAFVAYILPLIIVGVLSFFVNKYAKSRAMADGISFALLVVTVFFIALLGRKFFKSDKYQSSITEVLKNEQN